VKRFAEVEKKPVLSRQTLIRLNWRYCTPTCQPTQLSATTPFRSQ